MAAYFAKDKDGNVVNIIDIDPKQIPAWEAATGYTLELPPEPEPNEEPDAATMEAALNELGVATRE